MDWALQIDLAALDLLGDPKLIEAATEIAEAQIANMQLRLMGGIGVDDQPMAAYSQAYRRLREKSGRTGDKRTLNFTGAMQRSLFLRRVFVRGGDVVAEISFSTQKEQEKATYTNEQTPWFGVSPKDEAALKRLAELRIAEIIGG